MERAWRNFIIMCLFCRYYITYAGYYSSIVGVSA
jgi:hypothetical protein